MAASCVFSPVDKNNKPYKALHEYKSAFGAKTGSKAFLKALSPSFQERYKGKLEIDEQGVATLETAIKTSGMKELVGFQKIKEGLEKKYGFTGVSNSADNFRMLVNQAKNFNDQNDEYIAYPEIENGKLRNVIHKKDENSVKTFNDMYGSLVLNDRLVDMFSPLGLTVGLLSEAESGYSGITDFSKAKSIAGEFSNLIRVSNNLEGQQAMSEEFSHLIVRMLRDTPFIQRMMDTLISNPESMRSILENEYDMYVDKNTDDNGNVDYSVIAEECLGRLLQRSLIDNVTKQTVQPEETSYLKKLWQRAYNYIKKLFKGYDHKDVQQAVLDADQTMDSLAKNLLQGNITFKKSNIERLFSDERMYHLVKGVEYLQEVIEDRISIETKKTVIMKSDKAVKRAEEKLKNLNAILKGSPEGQLKGIVNYAHSAVIDLQIARESLKRESDEEKTDFAKLRGIRSTIQSYDAFIAQLGNLLNSNDSALMKIIDETSFEDRDHVKVTLQSVHSELSQLYNLIKSDFKDRLFSSVTEFFRPFFNVKGGFTDGQGNERSLEDLIREANGDIGFTDRYLMTMSSSSDLLLQLFDEVVKKSKAQARNSTINDLKEITKLMLDAEERGITNFDFMYEKDNEGKKTGNYISAINTGQYEKDKIEFLEQLDKEYGNNPTGDKAKEKRRKKKEWLESHGKMFGIKPNETLYHNNDFDRLSEDQKYVLNEFMKLKQKFDKRLPSNKVSTTRAIQMRRTSQQRLLNTLSNPGRAYENIREYIAKEMSKSSDDDSIYGVKTGLRSFDGTEFKVLPALYTRRLSNPEELTMDVFSALAAYSYSTNVYEEMDQVVDPLELASSWVMDYRKNAEVSNGKPMVEKVKGIVSPIYKKGGSNIVDKLNDFMDSQVYSRYYADSDKTVNMLGREVKAGKLVNKWISLSSMVQLGFNALAHLGNAATGAAMQNIEALCGHYFNAKELFKADGQYIKELMHYIPEIESKNPKSKLALFDQMFDIKQEFEGNIKNRMNKLFEKLFGKSLAFLGQTCGDHWLYNRTAIAMCLRKKVKTKDGTVTSLWDALHVENAFKGDDRIKELRINAVDAETGEAIDDEYIRKYSEKINEINHRLFGVYNTDDMVAAQRTALGRAMLQYRQWIVPLFARRFQKREYVLALGEYEEGYYRTTLHWLAGLRNGITGLGEVWDELDDAQRKNVYRAAIEFSQFLLIWAIANFVSFGKDDPDRFWGLKLAEYMAQRELHELGNLTPSFVMGNEILKTVKSPASILNTTQSAMNLVASLLDPRDWNDEIQSGKYEGMSTLHKNILKSPFPILAPFNQLERFTEDIEEVTRYYARSY